MRPLAANVKGPLVLALWAPAEASALCLRTARSESPFVHLALVGESPRFGLQNNVEFRVMPASLWSGNLRLSLVLIPVKLHAATTEGKVAFRQIHAPSGNPIRNIKGVRDGETFTEVPEDEIIKGYEHAKGHHILIHPEEIDQLKLEAKHTIDMVRFVDEADIDSRYLEKPYYLTPDGDDADEGYTVIREALKQTGKVAIGQMVMNGREHLVGIKPHGKGLMLVIVRYADEIRPAEPKLIEGRCSEVARNCGRGHSKRISCH
jgi:Ku protein